MSDFATINALNSNSNESHHTLEKIEDEPKATHVSQSQISNIKEIGKSRVRGNNVQEF